MTMANAADTGVSATGPIATTVSALPSATAARNSSVPSAGGPATATHISSSDQVIGWYTVTTTAARVRATMMSVNVRLPGASLPAGTAIAIQPSTPVSPTMPTMSRSRPSAERARTRIPSAPIA